jgi:hypothetical protein
MGRLAAFLASAGDSPPAVAEPAQPTPVSPTLVSLRDDSPEAAGIFRLIKGGDRPDPTPGTIPSAAVTRAAALEARH